MTNSSEEYFSKRFSKQEIMIRLDKVRGDYKHAPWEIQDMIAEFCKSFKDSMFINDCYREIEK